MNLKDDLLRFYYVKKDYLEYLSEFDNKVPVKNNRKYIGIIVNKNNQYYCIPLTSIVKDRNKKLTINISYNKKNISQLLLNNMIPINLNNIELIDINNDKDKFYILKELRYLKKEKVIEEILKKTNYILEILLNKKEKHKDYLFFKSLCCNFILLNLKCKEYNKVKISIDI